MAVNRDGDAADPLSEFAAGMAVAVMLHRRELSRRAGLVLLVAGAALVTGDALCGEWPANLAEALALTLALTLPVSALSWFAVERPALRWARRRPRLATAESG